MKNTVWVVAVAAIMAAMSVSAFTPRTAEAQSNTGSMRMPFSDGETWIVNNGYGSGTCHQRVSPCGGDEYYALDIVPTYPTTGGAGGKNVYAPVTGTVVSRFSIYDKNKVYIGDGIKIRTDDGYLVHLYHLMNIKVYPGQRVSGGTTRSAPTLLGQVYDKYYNGTNNHLHIQLSTMSGVSLPIKLSGKSYKGDRTWWGQQLQNNVLYYDANYSGTYSNYAASDVWLGDDAVGNDRVSSVRVNRDCTVWLFQDWYFNGRSYGFRVNTPNLVNYGFNDMASSMWLSC